jgi:hypothetical protein
MTLAQRDKRVSESVIVLTFSWAVSTNSGSNEPFDFSRDRVDTFEVVALGIID